MVNKSTLLVWIALLSAIVSPLLLAGDVALAQEGGGCGQPATLIHDIQGIGEHSPLAGETLTVEGVVVGDFQDSGTELGGFFLQEAGAEFDENPLTSEGIFVDSTQSRVDVSVGDVVRVTGTVLEVSEDGASLTQLRRVESIMICQHDATAAPIVVILPVRDLSAWEAFEGMLVTFPQTLTVTEVYNLGRYGEVLLSAQGRLYQPTQVAWPGAEALEVQAANARRSIILDDGNSQQNLDPTWFPAGGLSADNVLRNGFTVTGLTGVLDQRYGTYRLHATQPPDFQALTPRPDQPHDVGAGVRVASFNVLNYFNGDGAGGGFPTERGADTPDEFARQRAKIVSTLRALDAHVVGLIEIENDGSGPDSALADLVDALNEAAGVGTYALVADPPDYPLAEDGGDAIKQAIIYQPAAVMPVGDAVTTLDPPFGGRRPPVAQAFEDRVSGEIFIVAVNHFKSKDCTDATGSDRDAGDGQGCWNQERTQAARTLLSWLATDPTGTGDPDVLLLGDLNAYAMEDPVRVLLEAGYGDLAREFSGDDLPYTYVYYGQAGTLDYALASATLREQVSGAAPWHVNADEPIVFDYNAEFKSANHVESLYDSGPFRASDHDPVLVGLALAAPQTELVAAAAQATEVPTQGAPTLAPTQPAIATAVPTLEPTVEAADTPTPEPTPDGVDVPTPAAEIDEAEPAEVERPEPDADTVEVDVDLGGATWGAIAVAAGLIAVLIAMLGGWWLQRNRPR